MCKNKHYKKCIRITIKTYTTIMKDQNKNGNKMESYEFSPNLSKSVMQSQ